MLIATAGHVDHGKTALVRALTGVETDRLPEEKARGISIDLGFAYWRPDDGEPIGFVDVPGHERFVRNMLAGVGGASFALLVVAADDGVMPQTIEHVQILDLLGISAGAVAMTKVDRADGARRAAVRAGVQGLLAGTGLAAAPIFEVSALNGDGLPELAAALVNAPQRTRIASDGAFLMAVDRCFTVSGAGTVATGTVLAGAITVGEPIVVSPRGLEARVRGLQSAGRRAERVAADQRCAVNLAGIEVSAIGRGDWLVDPAMHAPTSRIAARVRALKGIDKPLAHGAWLHLHIGTADVPARMLSRRQTRIEAGRDQVVTLVLDRPIRGVNGARFVLRDQSGRHLIGGGRVVDPFPPIRAGRSSTREAVIAALEHHGPRRSLEALFEITGHEVEQGWFERTFNLPTEGAREIYRLAGARTLGREKSLVLSEARILALSDEVVDVVAGHHRAYPEVGGMAQRELRQRLAEPSSADLLGAVLRGLADEQRIAFSGPLVRIPGHTPTYAAAELEMWRALCNWLESQPPRTVTAAEAAVALRVSEGAVRAMLFRRRVGGDLWAVTDARFMLRDHVAALTAAAAALGDGFTAAQFRDATGIGRNHVIRLLEFFDRIGVTARRGDGRVMRPDFAAVVGHAEPWLPGEPPDE